MQKLVKKRNAALLDPPETVTYRRDCRPIFIVQLTLMTWIGSHISKTIFRESEPYRLLSLRLALHRKEGAWTINVIISRPKASCLPNWGDTPIILLGRRPHKICGTPRISPVGAIGPSHSGSEQQYYYYRVNSFRSHEKIKSSRLCHTSGVSFTNRMSLSLVRKFQISVTFCHASMIRNFANFRSCIRVRFWFSVWLRTWLRSLDTLVHSEKR